MDGQGRPVGRAGRPAAGHNVIGGGWEQLPSLEHIDSEEKVAELYRAAYPDMKASAIANYVGQLWSLVHRMQEGELVVLSVKTTGTIASGASLAPISTVTTSARTCASADRSPGWRPRSLVTPSTKISCTRSVRP